MAHLSDVRFGFSDETKHHHHSKHILTTMNTASTKGKRGNRGLFKKLSPRGISAGRWKQTKDSSSQATETSGSTERPSDYDEEAAGPSEKDPLVDASKKPKPRSGSVLWAKLREKKDELVYAQSLQEERDNSESFHSRKSRREQEIKDEIRNAVEFRLSHCFVAIVIYLGIAVLAYSFIFESWTIIDSVYFACVTFTTIGYGDLVPTSDASRMFTAFFALSGVACLGIALGVLGSNLVEAQTRAMDQASEMSQRQVLSLFDSSSNEEEQANVEQNQNQTPWYRSTFVCQVIPLFGLLFACCWMLGNESGWDAATTFYYCVITGSTVGFGDFYTSSQTGRMFAVPVMLLAVGLMGTWLGSVADAIVERRQADFHKRLKSKELTIADLEVMDADEDGKVSLAEYLAFMLVSMNKVDQELINELMAQFDRLDADGTGSLEKEDLILAAKQKLKNSTKRKMELAQYKQQLLRASGGGNNVEQDATTSELFMSAVSSKLPSMHNTKL